MESLGVGNSQQQLLVVVGGLKLYRKPETNTVVMLEPSLSFMLGNFALWAYSAKADCKPVTGLQH